MHNTEYKIAIIGPKDVVSGFKALGTIPFNAETSAETLEIIKRIRKNMNDDSGEKFAVIMIVEHLLQGISVEDYEKISQGALPALLSIPGLHGGNGVGVEKLRRLAEKAVGSDILK